MISGIDHIVLRVHDVAAATRHWEATFGLTAERIVENQQLDVKQAFLPLPDGTFLELVAPLSSESPLHRVLSKKGEGVHLVSLRVDDAHAAVTEWISNGAEVMKTETGVGFVLPSSASGTMIGAAGAKT